MLKGDAASRDHLEDAVGIRRWIIFCLDGSLKDPRVDARLPQHQHLVVSHRRRQRHVHPVLHHRILVVVVVDYPHVHRRAHRVHLRVGAEGVNEVTVRPDRRGRIRG